MEEIISTENLTKHYGNVKAVEGVSISVRKGEIYGFLGLNGAGKTTTIRMLLGMVRPTSGVSYLSGRRIHAGDHSLWRDLGYLVEIPYSYPDLTVRENLEIVRRLRLVDDPAAVDTVIEKLRLGEYSDRKAGKLSLGNAQRLGLAKALIHNPGILILDEPANGLDPAGIVEIRELLKDLSANHGVTIFLSSHILGEISRFATRIGIIHEGRLVREVNSESLYGLLERRLLLKSRNREAVIKELAAAGFKARNTDEGLLEIKDDRAVGRPEDIAVLLVNKGLPPSMLLVDEEDLETYFLRTIGMNGGVK